MDGFFFHLTRRKVVNRLLSWRAAGGERGAELVELALVFPLVIALLLGIIWVGRAYNIYETITHAAREGARYAVAPTCATCGDALPSASAVQAVVDEYLSVTALNPSAKVNYTFQQNVTLNPGSSPTVKGVVVSFSYPVSLAIPFVGGAGGGGYTKIPVRLVQPG